MTFTLLQYAVMIGSGLVIIGLIWAIDYLRGN